MASSRTARMARARRSAAAAGLPDLVASVPALRSGDRRARHKRLADIDVAEAGDQALVHERRLERRAAPGHERRERGAGELVAERLDADRLEMLRSRQFGTRAEVHQAETARIVEDDADARGHVKDDVVVSLALGGRMIVARGIRRAALSLDAEGAGHAEMHDQHHAVVEIGEKVFRPPGKRDDPPAGQPPGEAGRKGNAQVGPALLHLEDGRALHDGGKAPADRLDFRQLGQEFTPLKGWRR